MSWKELSSAQSDATWDRFIAKFAFRPSTTVWPGIREPLESVTYQIGGAYGAPDRYARITLDLSHKLVAALQRCVADGDVVHVLDWQHRSYEFDPHVPFSFESANDWPIPALPNGDYYLFLDPELRFGTFGHPWEQSLCIFGQTLVDAIGADLRLLFGRPIRVGGMVV